jgi:hypothetical protein
MNQNSLMSEPTRPPYSNRGVTLPVTITAETSDGPAFDAYCATVYAHPQLVVQALQDGLTEAGYAPRVVDGPKVTNYASNTLLEAPDGSRILSVRHGGMNFHPFVESKSVQSGVVAAVLRANFSHAPSRLDSAYDVRGSTAMAQLHAIAVEFEARIGLKLDYAGASLDNRDRGTTIYLGSRKSQAFVRVYEKGLQLASQMGLVGADIPDELRDWVRIELEYKPDKRPARLKATGLSPRALWGCSPWTREFASVALSLNVERVKMTERRETNQDRSMRYLVQQYGPTILRQVELLGSWEAFGQDLQKRLLVQVEEPA